MLQPSPSDCIACSTIPALLKDIDCRLAELGNVLYNNVVFILNKRVKGEAINDLLNYRRILTYKYCNPDYARPYTVEMIASRVKLLTAGVKNCCQCGKTSSSGDYIPVNPTTSSTTTI